LTGETQENGQDGQQASSSGLNDHFFLEDAMRVSNCVAIVTGGASGLGEACVRKLAAEGARVAIFDLATERGQELAASLGEKAIFARVDVTSEESVSAGIEGTAAAFGGINVLVNCAGVADPGKIISKKGPISMESFNKVIQINLNGTVNVIRLALQSMLSAAPSDDGERGVIINTASVAAFDGQIGQPAYSASKAGIVGMTLPLTRECADYGVRVMTIAPGVFDTPMVASLPKEVQLSLCKTVPFPKRPGKPEEYALLVLHIIENPMLNGEVIRLDGGIRMNPN
jgi:3-hydroxyacyl-CoA dehydrogenase / 3-hydroxy-2-methylbutyryl-CoA dehydrogenase